MVLTLQKEGDDDCSSRIQLAEYCISHKTLGDFVSCNTRKLFTALDVSQDFLQLHLVCWNTHASYIEASARVGGLKVVNDAAELH